MNSKAKGNRGERELAGILREYGYEARRGLQYQSGQVEADVVGLPGVHIEVKRVERGLNLETALQQSRHDARAGEIPVVMHRRNREGWKVTLELDDFMEIYGGPTR